MLFPVREDVVRCSGCELQPKKPARYCECCGKEITQHQAKAAEPVDTDWAPKRSAWDLRCPKCGGPSLDGGICQVCQRPTPPPDRVETAQNSSPTGTASTQTPSAAAPPTPSASMPSRPQMAVPAQHAMHSAPNPAPQREMPPPPLSEIQTIPVARERTPTPQPRRVQTDVASADRTRRPAVTGRVSSVPKPSQTRSFALIAASVLLVAGLGAAADWFFVNQEPAVTRDVQASTPAPSEQPAAAPVATEPAKEVVPVADNRAIAKVIPADVTAAAPSRTVMPAPAPKETAPSKPKPAATAPKPVASAKPARPAAPPPKPVRAQNARAVAAPAPALAAAPLPVAAPPVREVVAATPAPAEKATPVGPFFETKDVSEQPRVAGRVEPRLPADLKGKNVHEIVIVRALVSQNGHPSRVSVLRKSKAGPQLDDVVVAAVNQWTFSPAKKKGEPVSCWFNFGVTVGEAD